MPGFSIAAPTVDGLAARHSVAQSGALAQAGPATPAAPPALQSTSLPALREQSVQLRVQLAGLKAQWDGLSTQLGSMRLDNPARAAVQHQAADVGVQMAQVQGQIASIQEQIALRGGRAGTTVPPSYSRGPDPDTVVALTFVLLLAVALPFAIAFARRLARGGKSSPDVRTDSTAPRLDRIEQAVDAIAIEVERISEGQRFVTRLLAERPPEAMAPRIRETAGAREA